MGLRVAMYGFEVVPSLTLVRDTLAERLRHPVELVEHPPCFELTVSVDARRALGYRLLPSERAWVTLGFIFNPARPGYAYPEYSLLCRALTELGGRAAAVELDLEEFRQRFDFDGKVPTALEVHARLLALGGGSRGARPPRAIPSTFELSAPGLLPVVAAVEIDAGPGEIELRAGVRHSLLDEAAKALVSLGGQPLNAF